MRGRRAEASSEEEFTGFFFRMPDESYDAAEEDRRLLSDRAAE